MNAIRLIRLLGLDFYSPYFVSVFKLLILELNSIMTNRHADLL